MPTLIMNEHSSEPATSSPSVVDDVSSLSAGPHIEDPPSVKGFVRNQMEVPLLTSGRASAPLFAGNPLAMWIYDVDSLQVLELNESAQRQYGYTREEFLRLTLDDLRPRKEDPSVPERIYPGDPNKVRIHLKKDGSQFFVQVCANDVVFRNRPARYVVAEDVTERMHLHAQLLQLAHHDGLTGLPNRLLLEQRMNEGLAEARRCNHRAAIICLDLDHFKQINDRYGHGFGDECLRQVGVLLTRRLRGMDTVARTGGEEFTIFLGEVESVAAAGIVAKALLQGFSAPLEIEGHTIVVSASMGVSVYPDHGSERTKLWRSADAAMYRAKRAGGSRHVMVAFGLASAVVDTAGLNDYIRSSLQNESFQLHYQPQFFLAGRLRGMEALLRLPEPKHGVVSPDRFIPIAEGNGLIHPLGKWVLEEVCRSLLRWNAHRKEPLCIAVNVSPLQLMRPDFAAEVKRAVSDSGIDPTWLEMEITERVVLDFDEIARRMRPLADMGIRFAVDDFGTGYSSLQHLNRLPISTLKIDRSFVQQLSKASRSYPIVKAIIAMGHSLQMQIIAEGVEHEDELRLLNDLGCDGIQGYLLSRPLKPEAVDNFLGMDSWPGHDMRTLLQKTEL
jgi:diguanylate cyclase (GGDEF)-like protein/PAS domain S-box-containing protein